MEYDVTSIVNQIRQNLRDRYKSGFPIIKELVQNADDAFARRIDLVFTPGIPAATHPLLQGPSLVILNDGNFDEISARAMNSIGKSAKTDNRHAVGRYGLGLKSIFHLCEAFIFISNIDSSLHIVNPWAETVARHVQEDPEYPEWDKLEPDDRRRMVEHLKPVLNDFAQFLCIWVPLRQESHFSRRHAIIDEKPGENWEEADKIINPGGDQSAGLANELGRLFPQLRALETLNVWRLTDRKKPDQLVELTIANGAQRLAYPRENLEPNKARMFQGHLSVLSQDGRRGAIDYAGLERVLGDPIFTSLQNSKMWPKHSSEDPKTHKPVDKPDNAQPHSAAIFSRFPTTTRGGYLGISRAVFLPLEKQFELVRNEGKQAFGLTLHGWFFVDAGRTELPGWDRNYYKPLDVSEDLTLSWNGALAQKGTLQAIIPALAHFGTCLELSQNDVQALTEALAKSKLYQDFRRFICEKDQWVYAYHADRWIRLPAADLVIELPKPPDSDSKRPGRLFPIIVEDELVTIEAKPRLSPDLEIRPWPTEVLIRLLACMPIQDVFSSQGLLEYLAMVLEKALCDQDLRQIDDENSPVVAILMDIIQEAFRTIELNKLDENRWLIRKICNLIPKKKRFSIIVEDEELRKPGALTILRSLFQLKTNILITPKNFDSAPAINYHLGIDHAELIMRTIARDIHIPDVDNSDDVRSWIALQVFESFKEPYPLKQRCMDLHLFKGVMFLKGVPKEILLNLTELNNLDRADFLFRYTTDGQRSTLILRDLSKALLDGNPVIVQQGVNSILTLHASESSPLGVLGLLANKPRLAIPEKRKDLVRQMLPGLDSIHDNDKKNSFIAALRYILHGQLNHYDYQEFLYIKEEGSNAAKILAQIYLQFKGEDWKILDPELAQVLTHESRMKLKISQQSDVSLLLSNLRSLSIGEIYSLDFSEIQVEQRTDIIQLLFDQTGVDILRNLKIHEAKDGSFVPVTPTTFLDSKFVVPVELAQAAVMLRIPDKKFLLSIYEEMGVHGLDAEAIIRLALQKEKPEQHWKTIMDALNSCGNRPIEETLQPIRTREWLPTKNFGGVSPDQVLYIPGLDKEITELLSETDSVYISDSHLLTDVLRHPAWEKLTRWVLPDKRTAIRNLGSYLTKLEKYAIGAIDTTAIEISFLHAFCFIFGQKDGFDILPSARIIQKVNEQLGDDQAFEFMCLLCRPISAKRLINIFNQSALIHEKAPKDNKESVLDLFNQYLRCLANQPDLKNIVLQDIRLLNQSRKWKVATELIFRAKGIDPNDLLDSQQGDLLKLYSDNENLDYEAGSNLSDPNIYDKDLEAGAEKLLAYFVEWEPYVPSMEVIGGFLALLGDQDHIRNAAKKYLGNRDLKETREILKWKTDAVGFFKGESVNERLARQSFLIRIVDSLVKTVSVTSITGNQFDARLQQESSLEHLLYDVKYGSIPQSTKVGERFDFLFLRKLQLDQADPVRLLILLKKTAWEILHDVYHQDIENFDEYWQELEHTDQLDIDIAQDTIIENVFFNIPMLGLGTHEYFRHWIKSWEDNRNLEVQAQQNVRRKGGDLSPVFNKERERLRMEIKAMLESQDEKLNERNELLKAVRRKIGQEYQYKRDSILFELFQNADDAVAELGVLLDEPLTPVSLNERQNQLMEDVSHLSPYHRRVVVDWNDRFIRLAHWGRAINQIHPGSGSLYGYGYDLVKMLMMQRSDKSIAPSLGIPPLTGKFGLGFKSIFLVSSQPRVLSGRIKFEITAGMYPLRMSAQNLEHLTETLEKWGEDKSRDGTLIELPIDRVRDSNSLAKDVVNDFYQWAELLVVFAHDINRLELRHDGRVTNTIEWQPTMLSTKSHWALGKLENIKADGRPQALTALVWKTAKTKDSGNKAEKTDLDVPGSVLFTLNADGVVPLDKNVPKIWVTVPTEEKLPVGFVLNSNFALDVGRAQLARSSDENQKLAQDIGGKFAHALRQLFTYTQTHWDEFCSDAGLNSHLTRYEFWDSLWKTACAPMRDVEEREGYDLLRSFLDQSFGGLYDKEQALPTGLQADYMILTRLRDIHFYTSGIMDGEAFVKVAEWPVFRKKVPVGSLISDQIRVSIGKIFSERPNPDEVSLWKVVDWVIGPSGQVTSEQAALLGQLIVPDLFGEMNQAEKEVLRAFLKKLKFKSSVGKFSPVIEMLAPNIENLQDYQDEFLRSLFAPQALVLSKDYNHDGVQFFRACREKLSATADKLAVWALETKTVDLQHAVLNYLLNGELGSSMSRVLLGEMLREFESSWMFLLAMDHELLSVFNPHDCRVILGKLQISEDEAPPILSKLPDTKVLLEKIYSWWEQNQATLIAEYEIDTYPDGVSNIPSADLASLADGDQRRKWMILFLLGSYHTIGRVHKKAYRNFLEDCDQKGWLDTFTSSDSDAHAWFEVLETYLENISENDDAKYQYLFMRQFVQIYKISRYLPGYVEVFLGINRNDSRFNLDQLTNPNKSEIFSGSGLPMMPKLSNTLGIGTGFVLRELVRREIITSKYVFEHCFSPVNRIRGLFQELDSGLNVTDSTQIYRFLVKNLGEEKATFNKSFDIPFLTLADKYGNFRAFLDDNQ